MVYRRVVIGCSRGCPENGSVISPDIGKPAVIITNQINPARCRACPDILIVPFVGNVRVDKLYVTGGLCPGPGRVHRNGEMDSLVLVIYPGIGNIGG